VFGTHRAVSLTKLAMHDFIKYLLVLESLFWLEFVCMYDLLHGCVESNKIRSS
jgi:hypothetical protein